MPALLTTRFALLRALNDGPGYGLALIRRASEATDGAVRLNNGGVYQTLRDMEAAGLVQKLQRPHDRSGGKDRVWYEITDKGRLELESVKRAIAPMNTNQR